MAKKETEIAKKEETGLQSIPESWKQHAGMGTEKLGIKDVRPPRLSLAQAMSPQVKRSEPKYIEGLSEGDIFNDLTGEIYQPPVKFCVVTALGVRYVEFGEGGKTIVDGNVPPDDPRTQWTEGDDGERVKPKAAKFYDYLIWLPEQGEVMAFSIKNKQAATIGVTLNSLLKLPVKINGEIFMTPPACARLFELGTATDKNDLGSWAVYTLRNAGLTTEQTQNHCFDLAKSFQDKNVVIERDIVDSDEDDTSFDTSKM